MDEGNNRLSSLIYYAKKGDTEALDKLYRRFMPLVLNRVSKMKVDYRQEAKQILIMELIEAIKRFEPYTDWGKNELHQHIDKHTKNNEN